MNPKYVNSKGSFAFVWPLQGLVTASYLSKDIDAFAEMFDPFRVEGANHAIADRSQNPSALKGRHNPGSGRKSLL